MAQAVSTVFNSKKYHRTAIRQESLLVRNMLMAVVLIFLGLFLLMPVVVVLFTAFQKGLGEYRHAITTPDTWAAVKLTLLTAAVAVPLNLVFGIAASWAIAKFEFR